ncbi:MAG: hypothetical protein GYB68_12500 [Chloroflexi bacterium]|nr:hypothetical protein [Chloroflexota bacterium]
MRRQTLTIVILASVALILAACAPTASSGPQDEAAESASEDSAEESAPSDELLAGRPDAPPAPDEGFRSDLPEHVAATGRPQLVKFFAYWCSVCNRMRPTVHQLEADYWGQIDFVYLNIDEGPNQPTLDNFQFTSQPLFVFIDDDGTEIQRWFGFTGEDSFREVFDDHLNAIALSN